MIGITKKMEIEVTQSGAKTYRSLDHQCPAFEMMNEMRKNLSLCDVVLKTNDDISELSGVRAHKVVLASCSPFFEAMFTNFEERDFPSIELTNIDHATLEILVDYIYTAEVHINETNVLFLLPAANFFQLTGVHDACCDFLQAQMDPTNCLGIRSFAFIHDCPELADIADFYARENFEEVIGADEFLELPSDQLANFISSDWLMVSEEKIYQGVMSWIHANVKSRQQELVGLMEHVRLPLISRKYLLDNVEQDKLFMDDLECRSFLDDALAYQMFGNKKVDEIISFQARRQAIPRRFPRNVVLAVSDGVDDGAKLRSVVCFDLKSGKWHSVSKFPTPRRNAGVIVVGRKLYLIGGSEGVNSEGPCWPKNSVDVYDVDTDEWTAGPQMITQRFNHGVAVIDNCIYAVGGYNGIDDVASAEVYDLTTQEWREIAPMTRKRRNVALGVVNGLLYAVGGWDNQARRFSARIECYDPKKNTWTVVSTLSTQRLGLGVGVLDGILYSVGGWNGFNLRNVEAYNPVTNERKTLANMRNFRENPGIVISDGLLYAVGGNIPSQDEYQNSSDVILQTSIEVYSPETNSWTDVFQDSFVNCDERFIGVAALEMPISNRIMSRLSDKDNEKL